MALPATVVRKSEISSTLFDLVTRFRPPFVWGRPTNLHFQWRIFSFVCLFFFCLFGWKTFRSAGTPPDESVFFHSQISSTQSMQYFFLCARFLLAPVVSRVRLYLTFFLIRKHARPCRPMTLQYFVTKANKEISSSCRDIQKFCLYQQIEKLI